MANTSTYDVAIIGLGAMGSAAAYHLARRGKRVLGLDRFRPPHVLGSSHGRTRIIREAYFEHPLYVPLVQRAYECWAELERESKRGLLRVTGGLMIGPAQGVLVPGARRSALEHGIAFEELSAGEIHRRFPAFRPDEAVSGVLEPRAGVLFPEACLEACLELAVGYGADLRLEQPAERWEVDGDEVVVTTAKGVRRAGRLILAAGPWTNGALARIALPLSIERQVAFWFQPAAHPEHFRPDRCPIYMWEWTPGRFFYGFPDLGDGIKAARHHEGETTDPEAVRREVAPDEVEAMRGFLETHVPDANGPLVETATCLYTNTPDDHFVLDFHPEHPQVVIASPCSGHGFKFASVIGEILADLVTVGKSQFDLSPFRIQRLLAPSPPPSLSRIAGEGERV